MYKINQVTLPVDFDKSRLKEYLAHKLRLSCSIVRFAELNRLSIDARDKANLHYKASIVFDIDGNIDLKKYKNIEKYFVAPEPNWVCKNKNKHIVIVGSGPSGLFCGYALALAGSRVTILERGYEMSKRKLAVDNMLKNGVLDERCNIQFGEGGAGTFSDGKLNTGIKSEYIKYVLSTFHKFGANENIMYDARPHIGTDVLSDVIVNMRKEIERLGGRVLFEHKFIDYTMDGDILRSVRVETGNGIVDIPCDELVLAIGHSSRDTVRLLFDKNMGFRQKAFAMGYRIEHLQSDINISQYGDSPQATLLPPADYHIVEHIDDGRVVYSFCMCPGGVVVPAMSEKNTVVTNGMSDYSRNGVNANSALLVGINTSDFPSSHPLSGIDLQERYERYAYEKANGYKATVQRVGDFLVGVPTTTLGKVKPSYLPGVVLGSVDDMMPDFVVKSIKSALPKIGKKIMCFDMADAILTGVETRSSAPYQINRDINMMSDIPHIFAIGEGAGFAGGIVSSAVEGLKCASIICNLN